MDISLSFVMALSEKSPTKAARATMPKGLAPSMPTLGEKKPPRTTR